MPPEGNDRGRLLDIIAWGQEAIGHHAGRDLDILLADRQAYLAALYCIQVVGEAAWDLSDGVKQQSALIPWPLVSGMRQRLVHDYGRINLVAIPASPATTGPSSVVTWSVVILTTSS